MTEDERLRQVALEAVLKLPQPNGTSIEEVIVKRATAFYNFLKAGEIRIESNPDRDGLKTVLT